eukprot:8549518-Pyramimonas_sp.AAC.1
MPAPNSPAGAAGKCALAGGGAEHGSTGAPRRASCALRANGIPRRQVGNEATRTCTRQSHPEGEGASVHLRGRSSPWRADCGRLAAWVSQCFGRVG